MPEIPWRLFEVLDVSLASKGTNSMWFSRVVTKAKSKNGKDRYTCNDSSYFDNKKRKFQGTSKKKKIVWINLQKKGDGKKKDGIFF